MSRILLGLPVLWFVACATSGLTDDPVTPADPIVQESSAEKPQAGSAAAPAPSILSEPLQPVRGGARVLPPYVGPDPCRMALTGESPVAKACSDGGRRRAIELMNLFVKRARAEGIIFTCVDCHTDEDDLSKLTPIADVEFRKLLFLARPGDLAD